MHRGYIKLWRKIEDNWLWKVPRKFSKLEAWIDIIMQVQWNPEPEEVVIKNKVLTCNRGESLKSLETWAKRWNWDKSATRRFFNLLKKTGQIDTQSDTITTRLKVINYDTYCPLRHADDTELNSERNASETQVTPDNKDNKDNKVKKDKNTPVVFPDWLDKELWKEYKKYRGNGKSKLTPYAEQLAIKKLEKLKNAGDDPSDVIKQSMICGWAGLFPIKSQSNQTKDLQQQWYERKQKRQS